MILPPQLIPALLETMLLEPEEPRHLDRHLDRLATSAGILGHALDRDMLERSLRIERPSCDGGMELLRFELVADGSFITSRRTVPEDSGKPVLLAIDELPFEPGAVRSQHKTCERGRFDAARARHPYADDVVLVTTSGRVAETTIANIAVQLDGSWWTPPVADGALPGVGRQLALEAGQVRERSFSVDELRAAQDVALVSSVRGWRQARVIGVKPGDEACAARGR